MIRSRHLTAAAALLIAFSSAACEVKNPFDGVNIRLRMQDTPFRLTGLPGVQVTPGQVRTVSASVAIAGRVESIDEIHAIRLSPASFAFTPTPGTGLAGEIAGLGAGAGSAANTGVVQLLLRDGPKVLIAAQVTVTNNVVTAVSPSVASVQEMSTSIRTQVQQAVNANPGSSAQFGNWQNMTGETLLANINDLLTQSQATLTLVAAVVSGNVSGSIQLREFSLDGIASVTP
jgi:hypothetical protein